jgi:hypothetical protein
LRETPKAAQAFHEYLLLQDRSLEKLAHSNQKYAKSLPVFKRWSVQHHWQERIAAYEAQQAQELEAVIVEERAKILKSGFAQMHKRVELLDMLTGTLLADVKIGKLYLKDVKAIGNGKDARQVDLEQFNEGLIRQIRGLLDDLAKELGERVSMSKQELSGEVDITGVKDILRQRLAHLEQSPDEQ